MRIGDRQLEYAYTNATSTAKYHATRTRVIKDSGLVSEYDVKTRATVTATKYGDPQQILTATIRGNTATAAHPKTIVIGDEIQVTSTYLGLTNAWYIVQRFSYTTTDNMTTLLLHPRVSATGLQKEEIGSFEQAMQTNRRGSSDPYVPPPAENII